MAKQIKEKEHRENIGKAMQGNDNALKYKGEETDNLIYKLCLLGLKDKEMSDILDISENTFNQWKKEYPTVSKSITKGKYFADINVAQSMYKRAVGYEQKTVKVFYDSKNEKVIEHELLEHYPPDVTAQKKWLSARQRHIWADRVETDITSGGEKINNVPDWVMQLKNGSDTEKEKS